MSTVRAVYPRQTSAADPNLSTGEQVLQLVANPFQASVCTWLDLCIIVGTDSRRFNTMPSGLPWLLP
jgi:hypothetical protein